MNDLVLRLLAARMRLDSTCPLASLCGIGLLACGSTVIEPDEPVTGESAAGLLARAVGTLYRAQREGPDRLVAA